MVNQNTPQDRADARSTDPIGQMMRLIERLRGEDGCPWDRKQTPRTMVRYLAEEIFELMDAIESDQTDDVCQELGDVLFLVLFVVDIFRDQGRLDLSRIAAINVEKMIRRHPHVFGQDHVDGAAGVKQRWQEIKKQEKTSSLQTSTLDSVPRRMPALMRAYKLSDRASKTGFDWRNTAGVVEKVKEEWGELQQAIAAGDQHDVDDEFGDLMFSLVNLARFIRTHPETAMDRANQKFEKRFRRMETLAAERGLSIESMSAKDLDQLWQHVKRDEKPGSTPTDPAGLSG